MGNGVGRLARFEIAGQPSKSGGLDIYQIVCIVVMLQHRSIPQLKQDICVGERAPHQELNPIGADMTADDVYRGSPTLMKTCWEGQETIVMRCHPCLIYALLCNDNRRGAFVGFANMKCGVNRVYSVFKSGLDISHDRKTYDVMGNVTLCLMDSWIRALRIHFKADRRWARTVISV